MNVKWPGLMLKADADERATSAWLLYDIATVSEAPRQPWRVLQYCLLACALVGPIGSVVIAASAN